MNSKDLYSMSIGELKQEYIESYDNPIKKVTIRQILKEKNLKSKLHNNENNNNATKKSSTSKSVDKSVTLLNGNRKRTGYNKHDKTRNYNSTSRYNRKHRNTKNDYYEFTDDDFLDGNNESKSSKSSKSNIRESSYDLSDDDFNLLPNHGNLNEFYDDNSDEKYENRFKKEVDSDYVNNNLMDRMNSEMEIRCKKNTNKNSDKNNFILPYDNSNKEELFDVYYNEKYNKDFRNRKLK